VITILKKSSIIQVLKLQRKPRNLYGIVKEVHGEEIGKDLELFVNYIIEDI